MSNWDYKNVGSLKGKVIIVTGGNCGLGYESVKFFASKDAKVVLAARSLQRGSDAAIEIKEEFPKADINVLQLDLASLESVKSFADKFISQYERLDILMNNAGIMSPKNGSTSDGFEHHMGINHLGHFALTGKLFNALKTTPDSRIVTISSLGHRRGTIDYSQMMYDQNNSYDNYSPYGSSKLANLLFTYELQRKIDDAGLDIKALSAHPGGSMTSLVRQIENKLWFKLLLPLFNATAHSVFDGALPGIRASLDENTEGGQYYGPSGLGELRGEPTIVKSSDMSYDKQVAQELWKESEKLTSVVYDFS